MFMKHVVGTLAKTWDEDGVLLEQRLFSVEALPSLLFEIDEYGDKTLIENGPELELEPALIESGPGAGKEHFRLYEVATDIVIRQLFSSKGKPLCQWVHDVLENQYGDSEPSTGQVLDWNGRKFKPTPIELEPGDDFPKLPFSYEWTAELVQPPTTTRERRLIKKFLPKR